MPESKAERYHGRAWCMYMVYGVRVLSGAVGICCCVLSYFGFEALDKGNTDSLPSDDKFFMGLSLFYLFFVGLLTLLAEIRAPILKDTVLHPFGFLKSFLGRGVFYLFIGSFLVTVDNTLARILGGFLFLVGFLEIVMSVALNKQRRVKKQPEKHLPPDRGPGDDDAEDTVIPNPLHDSTTRNGAADLEVGERRGEDGEGIPTENPFLRDT